MTLPDAMRLVLEFVRTTNGGDPYGFRFGRQQYLQRSPGGTYKDMALDWNGRLLTDLAALRTSKSAEFALRLSGRLRRLLPGWPALSDNITTANQSGEFVEVIIQSAASELYLLPWELLTVDSGEYVGALQNVLVRYAWPSVATKPVRTPDRILFAWSAADKPVPRDSHYQALHAACTEAGVHLDALPHVSTSSLGDALAQAKSAGRPISALHVLCHGVEHEGAFELLWNRVDGNATLISADRLRELLAPHADELSIVTLCACDSGNAGKPDSHLGSLARALHRIKIPAVIGSRYRLSKPGSVAFADVFYRRLLADRTSVPVAFQAARKHLREHDHADPNDWMSVRLYAGVDKPIHRYSTIPLSRFPDECRGSTRHSSTIEALASRSHYIPELDRVQRNELSNILQKLPTMQNREGRRQLLEQLPRNIRVWVKDLPSAYAHIHDIVSTCTAYSDGIEALYDALRRYEDNQALAEIDRFFSRLAVDIS